MDNLADNIYRNKILPTMLKEQRMCVLVILALLRLQDFTCGVDHLPTTYHF